LIVVAELTMTAPVLSTDTACAPIVPWLSGAIVVAPPAEEAITPPELDISGTTVTADKPDPRVAIAKSVPGSVAEGDVLPELRGTPTDDAVPGSDPSVAMAVDESVPGSAAENHVLPELGVAPLDDTVAGSASG